MTSPATPSAAPAFFAAAAAWLDDRMGAILVKEARQAVRSRFVVSMQFLFLAVLVITLGAVLLGGSDGQINRNSGREVFIVLNVMLHVICVVCVPLYVGLRMAAERGEANVDLMFSTTLRPMSIVWGKTASGLLVGLLAVSACAPFMILCYFLRGVDVPTILFCIAVDLVFLVLATVVAVFIGALPVGWVIKGVVALGYGVLACYSVYGLGYGVAKSFTGESLWSKLVRNPEVLLGLGIFGLAVLAAAGLFFMVASAMIAPPTANRALPVRGYLSGLWIVSGLVVASLLFDSSLRKADFGFILFGWALVWSCVLALGLIVGASERDALGARMRRSIPASSGKRKLAFLFYSGAAGGLAWAVGMAALTLGVAWGGLLAWHAMVKTSYASHTIDRIVSRGVPALGLGLAMVLAYMLLASGIRRYLFARFTRSIHTGVIGVVLMVAGMLLPLLGSFLMHGGRGYQVDKELLIHAFNPFSPVFFASEYRGDSHYLTVATYCSVTAAVMLAVGVALSGVWFLRQVEAFGVLGKPHSEAGEGANA